MRWLTLLTLTLFFACRQTEPERTLVPPGDQRFTSLPAEYTGIDFVNQLEYDEEFNVYTYRNFYNGGGVGIGDINNDGLPDLFFCGNMTPNRLYLNKGNFRFEDITDRAGVAAEGVWTSGVSFADVNGDGRLDIYLCKSGSPEGENRHNELFINNGDLTFTEQAEAYGIADLGLSTHAAFFDYDKDGDLDCYLLNNSIRPVGGYDLREGQREIPDPQGGNKLYRLDGDRYTDVSREAGIYSSAIGFGLGVTIGDVNRDGWPDIYVSNDFFEKDYLYINNQNGAFTESLEEYIREISLSSMGADMADINNDGYPEIFVTDMLPEDDARMKTKTHFENWDKYQLNLRHGYYRQFTRNVLQLNRGRLPDPAPDGAFSEIGRYADVYATDWSWGALMADFDNDGLKDIFVANGIFKDLTDQDYVNFYSDPETVRAILSRRNAVIKEMIDAMPSEPVPNYLFVNRGDLRFENVATEWGLGQPGFSNGSAYGDLDNDGDLDLVTNNTNMPPFVFRNETDTAKHRFLSLELKGKAPNTFALGSQVVIRHGGQVYYQELAPMRGFESCVDHRLHFGLGGLTRVDTLEVHWPDGQVTRRTQVATNQRLTLDQSEAGASPLSTPEAPPGWLQPETDRAGIDFVHQENDFVDFDRDRLLYQMVSAEGPPLAAGDVNGDGLEDLYFGGAKDQAGQLYLARAGGGFRLAGLSVFEEDRAAEDSDALFFDADGDGDLDLYVAGGSYEFPATSSALKDRLYFNDGRGGFQRGEQILPAGRYESTGAVEAADYDGDGDLDLFVGLRLRPFLYGVPAGGYLLENDGRGRFNNITKAVAPALADLGMVTAAAWLDGDGDGDPDLLTACDWGPLQYFRNDDGQLTEVSAEAGLAQSGGFWRCLQVADLDGDGDLDLVAGNHGRNTRLQASAEKPVRLYVNDFDRNGTVDHVLTLYNGEEAYPLALRHDLVMQMPELKKKYLKYENYKEQTIEDIFTPSQMERTVISEVHTTASQVLWNNGDGAFERVDLPWQAQLSPVNAIVSADLAGDGLPELLLGGNFYHAKPELGIHDASYGLVLRYAGEGRYRAVDPLESGLFLTGEIRSGVALDRNGGLLIVLGRNNSRPAVFSKREKIQ